MITTKVRNISYERTGVTSGYIRVLLRTDDVRPTRVISHETLLTFVPEFDRSVPEMITGAKGVIAATDITGLLLDDPQSRNGQALLEQHIDLVSGTYLLHVVEENERLLQRWQALLEGEKNQHTRESLMDQQQSLRETNANLRAAADVLFSLR